MYCVWMCVYVCVYIERDSEYSRITKRMMTVVTTEMHACLWQPPPIWHTIY